MIDFKEIPQANSDDGDQDTFELFARDFLELLNYEMLDGPARGADGGKDLKVKEKAIVNGRPTELTWLVSCKHYVFSGKAIGPAIESNILDRVTSNGCDGIICFYSTLPTNGLTQILSGSASKYRHKIFDRRKIEGIIVGDHKFETLFARYFPVSYKNWRETYYYLEPIKLFENYIERDQSLKGAFELFVRIFGTTGFLLKALRSYHSFEEALSNTEVGLTIEPKLYSYCNKRDFDFVRDGVQWHVSKMESTVPREIYSFNQGDLDFRAKIPRPKSIWDIFSHPYFRYLHGIPPATGRSIYADGAPFDGKRRGGQIRFIPGIDPVTLEMKHKYGLELAELPNLIQVNFEKSGTLYFYPNHLIMDESYLNHLQDSFLGMKELVC